MSLQEIRKLRLLKRLEDNSRIYSKSQNKRRVSISMSTTENLKKINKNKKYMLEEERNTEIERDNRMLYEKIMGHFKNLKESMANANNIASRHKWKKRKQKNRFTHNDQETYSHINPQAKASAQSKFRSRVHTQRQDELEEPRTLFYGNGEIDGVILKIKIVLTRTSYYLLARNEELSIQLQMKRQEYLKIHYNELGENPCNIFKYLEIVNNQIRFRQKQLQPLKIPKIKASI